MFSSIKNLIHLRLDKNLAIDEFVDGFHYTIKVKQSALGILITFFKTDPDLQLNVLDQIVALPKECNIFSSSEEESPILSIMYQFKSLKLPYRVSLWIDIHKHDDAIKSIGRHFLGARWYEDDIAKKYDLVFEIT